MLAHVEYYIVTDVSLLNDTTVYICILRYIVFIYAIHRWKELGFHFLPNNILLNYLSETLSVFLSLRTLS